MADKGSKDAVDVDVTRDKNGLNVDGSANQNEKLSTMPADGEGEGVGFSGWAAVVGAFLIQFCGFGYSSSFGVYQDFYVRVHISNESPSTISWIGSTNAFLAVAGGLLSGRLYDRGYFYHLLWGGSILTTFSLFMLSLTQPGHFYQVFLTQSVGAGIGAGMIYVPSVAVVSQYFSGKRRNSMMTFVASGSSLGSVIHPIMLNNTLGKIGFANAARANAGLIGLLYLIAALLMRTKPGAKPHTGEMMSMKDAIKKFARDRPYVICSFASFFFTTGIYFAIFYLQLDAIKHGISENFAFYSLVILNFSQFIGRVSAGFLVGRYIGLMTLVLISTFCASVMPFGAIGLGSVASVVLIGILFGLSIGTYIAISAPLMATFADNPREIGLRIGIGFLSAGVGALVSGPISGALLTNQFIWWRPAVFSGLMGMLGFTGFVVTAVLLRRRKAERAKALEEKEKVNGFSEEHKEKPHHSGLLKV